MEVNWPEPYPGAHWLGWEEERAVMDVVRRRALFRFYGIERPEQVAALEEMARKFYGMRFALAVNSGTGALMTALSALGIGPGSEVILPSFFWVATVSAAVQANAIPVLCEVDDSFQMDPADLERKISPRTRLIVPVHMAGAVCDMERILAVAQKHGIPVLEDCAQANGGEFRGKKAGTFGKIGMFSLQWNKNATCGEGGLLVTNDPTLYERCLAAHDLGIPWIEDAPCETGPHAVLWGQGRRMGELQGAVAAVQLGKLPRILERLRASKKRIQDALRGIPGLSFRRLTDEAGDTGAFIIFILESEARAIQAAERLRDRGFRSAVRIADYGLHVYSNVSALVEKRPLSPAGNPWNLPQNQGSVHSYKKGACPRSDGLFACSILLPVPSRLTPQEEEAGIQALREAFAR